MTRRLAAVLTLWAAWLAASGLYAITLRDAAEYVVLAAGVVTALGVIWGAVEKLRRRLERQRHERLEVLLIDLLQPVLAQLTPNGGASMADKVARIELMLMSHTELSEADRQALHDMLDALTARVDRIEAW